MASLRERLLKRSAPTPAPDAAAGDAQPSGNGTQPSGVPEFTPQSVTQVSKISMLSTLRGRTIGLLGFGAMRRAQEE